MTRLMKLLVLSLLALAVAGCNEKESKPPQVSHPQPVKTASVVVVPDSVKGKWKAVKIQVADKFAKRQHVYTLPIGSEFKLPGSDLTLLVANFLPHFVMEGTTLTSQSNEPKNPAAQLVIKENGKEIFRGWLFSLYPTTHAFQHPQYGFTLVDFIPAS
ncbi:lipoprotein [Geomonas sp. Red276]